MGSTMIQPQPVTNPFDALVAHFTSSSKSVQRAFAKYIFEAYSGNEGVKRPKRVKKLSAIERSLKEVEAGELFEAKDLDDLFAQLNS